MIYVDISILMELLTGIMYDKKPFVLWGQFRDIGYSGEGKR